jgi:VWFA-related protein
MRRLLRGRYGKLDRSRIAALCLAAVVTCLSGVVMTGAQENPSFRITSPLGRSGLTGRIRVLARLDGVPAKPAARVAFYVDGVLLAEDTDGPPYEALWDDDNPFERREISAQATLNSGAVLTAAVVLEPMLVTLSTQVTSVAMEASVLDGNGQFVRGLGAEDFELFEDAAAQAIDSFTQRRDPALFTLLIDSSRSMARRAETVRTAARALLESLNDADRVIVAPFSLGITTVTGPTTDRDTILHAIAAIEPTGGTAILNALQEAAAVVNPADTRSAVVLITDGYDEDSTAEFAATVEALRMSDATVYVIGIGGVAGLSLRGEQLLSDLAKATGGRAWFPRDERRLAAAYATAAAEVHHRYSLAYTPANQRQDGAWRSITLTTHEPDWEVRTRDGYFAPAASPITVSMEFSAVGEGQLPAAVMAEELEVVEDGVPQVVDTFQEAVLPVTITLALDASGSMVRSAERAQEAAREFVLALRPEDQLSLIVFGDRVNVIHVPTLRRDASLEGISEYAAAGGTALYDAVYDALDGLSAVDGRRAIVVVTDGLDENAASNGPGSLRTWEDVLRRLDQTEAAVYAVGIGSRVDQNRLQSLAERSGGTAYFPSDVTALAVDYAKILDELRRRYGLGYESTNLKRDGAWREVEIRSRRTGVILRSRSGYFAPTE